MKQILILSILALLLYTCQSGNKRTSTSGDGNEIPADTIAYSQLLDGFEKQFAALEAEYDLATAERQLELEASFEELDRTMVKAQRQFVRDYPASHQSLMVLNEIDWSFELAAEYRKYLDLLDPALHESGQYRDLDNLVTRMELVEEGKQAPDFAMPDVNGKTVRITEVYSNSKYLLLDFWASHCGPCRKENANIRLAFDRFNEKGFDVLGVSTDTRREQWINAIETDKLIWTNVCSLELWNDNEVVRMYALRQVSQNFLLDSTGKIIATELRGEDLLAILEELFK